MLSNELKKSRVDLITKVSTISCKQYHTDSNRTNLDMILSLYLEFEELQAEIPKCVNDIVKSSIKEGDVVKTLKVKRGREMDLDQQFEILMCLLIIQVMEGKSQLNKYTENGLSHDECVEKTANDCDTSISNVYKCIKKYGNTFKDYLMNNEPEISFIYNKGTKLESKITIKDSKESISDMIKEGINITFR